MEPKKLSGGTLKKFLTAYRGLYTVSGGTLKKFLTAHRAGHGFRRYA